jgi:hypothetical protein
MDKLKRALRGNDEASATTNDEERGIMAEAMDASSLSWSTRVKGFIACFVLGCLISILSTVLFALTFNLVIILRNSLTMIFLLISFQMIHTAIQDSDSTIKILIGPKSTCN